MEETGIAVKLDKIVDTYDNIIRDSEDRIKYHYFIVHCIATYESGTPRVSEESSEVAWVDIQKIDEMDMNSALKRILHATAAK